MYVTYKITCTITGKYYIGSHKTDDLNDNYMGSGKMIKESIKKFGIENHKKEILGIFDTREESIELEHTLVKEKRKYDKNNCLNKTNGGFSFDYINENLLFNRSEFGKNASHQCAVDIMKERIMAYNKNPKVCIECGKTIDYKNRRNTFCSSGCSATYNNKKRSGFRCVAKECLYCGKKITVERSSKQKFCGINCSIAYRENNRELTETQQILINDIEKIKERHKTESYRKIAMDYGVSGNYIKDLLKGRICKQ